MTSDVVQPPHAALFEGPLFATLISHVASLVESVLTVLTTSDAAVPAPAAAQMASMMG